MTNRLSRPSFAGSVFLARLLLAVAVLLAVGFAPVTAMAQPITEEEKSAILKRAEQLIRDRAYAANTDFSKWPDMLAKNKEALDDADTVPRFSRVMNRMLNEFGISHIDLLAPRVAEQRKSQSMVGVGISWEPVDAGARITKIVEGGPAQKVGIQEGDIIVLIDGKVAHTADEVASLRGEENTVVTVNVKRGDQDLKFEITRAKFSLRDPEEFVKIGEDAAVIRVPSFDANYDRERLQKFFKEAADLKYLVIDLRSNGGGSVTNLYHFLGMLLPRGTEFGTTVNKDVADRYVEETGGDPSDVVKVAEWSRSKWRVRRNAVPPFTGKVAVLINRGSASASEITAAALRELHDPPAQLIGDRSAGAVLVANEVRMPDGFQMTVPVSDYVTIKGVRLEGHPLQPDTRVSGRIARKLEEDAVVKAAIEKLRGTE